MSSVITVENLSKKYIICHQAHARNSTLRDALTNGAKRISGQLLRPFAEQKISPTYEEFWALQNVSFEIREGERVGVIGRNGAGKSTLLKILSRITEPSQGRVRINGRVASLLEVGTGFHPDLTGRENIFLNGAILGMSRREIQLKFDEVVAFAEVERFLDTPVKRYSSGMYVRLAFAVAAHLEPEILIVDEVLAVGDAQFQKKCLGKMKDVGKEGRTVLFVSHNMKAIEQLCTSVLLLEQGTVKDSGKDIGKVLKNYLGTNEGVAGRNQWQRSDGRYDCEWFSPTRMSITDFEGNPLQSPYRNDTEVWISIEGEIANMDAALQVGYALYDEEGQMLYWTCHTDTEENKWASLQKGRNVIRSKLPRRLLNEGIYRIEMLVALYLRMWLLKPGENAPAIALEIQGGLSKSPYWMIRRPGVLAPVIEWKLSS